MSNKNRTDSERPGRPRDSRVQYRALRRKYMGGYSNDGGGGAAIWTDVDELEEDLDGRRGTYLETASPYLLLLSSSSLLRS